MAAGVRSALEPNGKEMCAGCGSKVGASTLAKTLEKLPKMRRKDVVHGPGDDAAILKFGRTQQVITVDHLRAFTNDYGLLARITAVHALGDVWAMGAAPQAVLASVTLPNMSPELQARSMSEIMQNFAQIVGEAGAEIVGGHSTIGAEMTLGLTVTGVLDGAPITQSGAKPGDVLVLTRPLGTGTILAGEMAGRASGNDVAAMLGGMATPQGAVAQAFLGAHAMTDVTGFGLAGHLMAMCRASGVGAEIDLETVPLYDGALALSEAGIRSSIWTENAAFAPVSGGMGARGALLHDPQTAGGFLAAIAPQEVDTVLARGRAAGAEFVVIGHMVDAAPGIRVI
jgi:selenide,water dikinase